MHSLICLNAFSRNIIYIDASSFTRNLPKTLNSIILHLLRNYVFEFLEPRKTCDVNCETSTPHTECKIHADIVCQHRKVLQNRWQPKTFSRIGHIGITFRQIYRKHPPWITLTNHINQNVEGSRGSPQIVLPSKSNLTLTKCLVSLLLGQVVM